MHNPTEQNKFLTKNPKLTSFSFSTNQQEIAEHKTEDLPCASYFRTYYNDWYPYHWHEEFEFTIIESGRLLQLINGQEVFLSEGDVLFINSSALHSFISIENVEVKFRNLLFHPSLIFGSTDSLFWRKYIYPLISSAGMSYYLISGKTAVPWQKKIKQLLNLTSDTLKYKEWCYEFRIRDMLSETIYLLCSHNPAKIINPTAQNTLELERLRIMLAFIHQNYSEPIQLQDIADSASISRRECLRCFNKIIKVSPMQYVMDYRLREAMKMLLDSKLTLLDICMNCGFQNQSYFTKVFREHTGLTPGKYRKQ